MSKVVLNVQFYNDRLQTLIHFFINEFTLNVQKMVTIYQAESLQLQKALLKELSYNQRHPLMTEVTPKVQQQLSQLPQSKMLQFITFPFYSAFLILAIIFIGFNYFKIRDKYKINPDTVLFIIPFIVNYILAKFFFYDIDPLLTTFIPCIFMFFIGRKLKTVRIFGLTGGIATGKSTLGTQMKRNLPKLHVIDCDQISTNLRKKDRRGYKLILKLLGDKVQQFVDPKSEQLDRQKLSNFVFQNAPFRRKISQKMGRLIFWQILKDIFVSIYSNKNLIMIDAPILYESKVLEYLCYPIIVVGCSEQQQIIRLEKRNNYSRQQALKRIKAQMPLHLKQKKSDVFIKNEGTTEDLLKNTLSKLNKYLVKK